MEDRKLQSNSFNEYPHYVYATAFFLDDKLMDYSIGSYEKSWETRTFRGNFTWERYVWENFDSLNLYCKYKKKLVNNSEEHNKAFDILEKWIKKYRSKE